MNAMKDTCLLRELWINKAVQKFRQFQSTFDEVVIEIQNEYQYVCQIKTNRLIYNITNSSQKLTLI